MAGDGWLRAALDAAGTAVPWVATFLLHSTVLLAAAWLLDAVLRERAPRVRATAWRTALVGGVLTATLSTLWGSLGTPAFARSTWTLPTAVAPFAAPSADGVFVGRVSDGDVAGHLPTMRAADRARREGHAALGVASPHPGAIDDRSVGAPGADATRVVPVRSAVLSLRDLPSGAVLLGFVGAIALLARRVRAERRMATILARRIPAPAGALSSALESAAPRWVARVRLSTLDGLSTPVAFGVLHPEICVPPRAVSGLEARSLRALLAHEVAHLEARDPAWGRLFGLLAALLWFQPLHRVAARRLESASEALADAAAVALEEGPEALASCLVEVAGWTLEGQAALPLIAMARPGPDLVRRVERLLAGAVRPERDARGARLVRTGAAVGCVAAAFLWAPVVCGTAVAATLPVPEADSIVAVARTEESVDPAVPSALDDELRALEGELAALERAAAPHPRVSRDLLARLRTQVRRLAERAQALRDALHPPPPPSSR